MMDGEGGTVRLTQDGKPGILCKVEDSCSPSPVCLDSLF